MRVDSHLYSGYTVPPYYDSLIAKIITHAETREMALARMRNSLGEVVVEGIRTNVPLLQDLCADKRFMEGAVEIHYLERRLGL